jgi:chromosome segregation ATPase
MNMAEINVLANQLTTLHEDVVEMKDALKSLSTAITKLALIEERQAQAGNALQRAFEAIERIERRLSDVERVGMDASRTSAWMDRALWAVAAAAAMFVAEKVGLI